MKKKLVISGIIVLIAVCGVIGFVLVSKNNEASYIEKLETTRLEMLDGGSKAESLCNLTNKVWYNAIYEEQNDETDKYVTYTLIDSIYATVFYHNFEDAINNLYSDEEIINTVSEIEENQKHVKLLIKDLQNPPKDLENCYDTILNMYDYYKNLTDLAISPTGSLEDYSDSKNDAVDGFMTEFEKLDNIMPE